MSLTLHPILFLSEGSSGELAALGKRKVIQYEVRGLPLPWSALIGRKDGHWCILRVRDKQPEDWHGEYETAEAALQALKAELGH